MCFVLPWGLEATYLLIAHWKARSGLPISVIFLLGDTAEALLPNIG